LYSLEGLKIGKGIYEYLKKIAQYDFKVAFPMYFDSLKFIVSAKERFNPINFGIDYHALGYDGAACYWEDRTGGLRLWSLYSANDKTDVSVICKKRGGGGHFDAAGFTEPIEKWNNETHKG
jgi:hypothetical protein